jgi:hypothetical protein
MTVAPAIGVMASMFRIRWRITICLLEIGLRVVLLSAFFARSGVRRPAAAPAGALGLVPGFVVESQPNREKIGV